MPPDEVGGYLRQLQSDERELRKTIHEIMWHMRGGLTRDDAFSLSPEERKEILESINSRIENVEKTGLPLL